MYICKKSKKCTVSVAEKHEILCMCKGDVETKKNTTLTSSIKTVFKAGFKGTFDQVQQMPGNGMDEYTN